ncbi:MAG TPA: hypothetical protein VFV85_00810, partial [Conexibacter sp.]|nr:hypothetical protein [Conexibacter sp.]
DGHVNPNGADTTVRIEYGTTPSYGTTVPAAGIDVGGSSSDQAVSQALAGLQPDTVYHYRVVARNSVGTTTGGDHTFVSEASPANSGTTPVIPGRGFLPDNRGWELVSPPDKHGGEVMGDAARTHAASDGSAVSFSSLQGFGDVRGTGAATDYLSERSSDPSPGDNGWSTHAIFPPQSPLTLFASLQALDPLWEGEMSDDLTHGVFRAWSPVTDDPDVADVQNLYMRSDLRTAGAGTYSLVSPCPACGGTPLPAHQDTGSRPWLVGTSSDFSHVVFESTLPLIAAANSGTNLFEWTNGTLRLVDQVPPSGRASCGPSGPACIPASGASAGASIGFYSLRHVSSDGSRIFFGDSTGNLYERIDGTTTVQINASETGTPASQPVGFQTASTDGRRVFFTTVDQLIASDTDNAVDLYMYDETAPAGHRLTRLSTDEQPADPPIGTQAVIGASRDGHWVYFVNAGQIAAGKAPIGAQFAIYLWHDGAVSFIGRMADVNRDSGLDEPGSWNLQPLQSRVTPDGHSLLFASHTGVGLTGNDQASTCGDDLTTGTAPCQELYVYNAAASSLTCISCAPNGNPSTQNAIVRVRVGAGGSVTTWHLPHAFSDDGTKAFFSTRAALVPGDSNGKVDAYEWEADGTAGCARVTGCVSLLSSGTDPADSYFMDASANGDDVFILTRQQLVGWDTDANYDLYDARVNGGFPQPAPATPGCSADACQGPPNAAPAAPAAGSTTLAGPGNVKASPRPKTVRCKRGYVRKKVKGKVRCVKKRTVHRAKRRKAHRRAKKARHAKKGGAK